MSRKLTINEVKIRLSDINKDIVIVDEIYVNSKTKMECMCLKCNHKWKANWNNLSNGSGCPSCFIESNKLKDEDIVHMVQKNNYRFIEFIKRNIAEDTILKVECPHGHVYEVSYRAFQKGHRCAQCEYKRRFLYKLTDIEVVKKAIEKNGYSIVGEIVYENNKSKFTIACTNGHTRYLNYHYLVAQPNCRECSIEQRDKYTIDEIRATLKVKGFELLSDKYDNSKTILKYRCTCGSVAEGRFWWIKQAKGCKECSGKRKLTIAELCSIFEENGCELLTNVYTGNTQKLKFVCHCGRIGHKTINEFHKSKQCPLCGLESRSGKNHPNYREDLTDEERNRSVPQYKEWRNNVFERDGYTCQCCGVKNGYLNAHHLDSYNWAKDSRTDVNNGITLCDTCHTDFHNIYGYGNNTREQFDEYMQDIFEELTQSL